MHFSFARNADRLPRWSNTILLGLRVKKTQWAYLYPKREQIKLSCRETSALGSICSSGLECMSVWAALALRRKTVLLAPQCLRKIRAVAMVGAVGFHQVCLGSRLLGDNFVHQHIVLMTFLLCACQAA